MWETTNGITLFGDRVLGPVDDPGGFVGCLPIAAQCPAANFAAWQCAHVCDWQPQRAAAPERCGGQTGLGTRRSIAPRGTRAPGPRARGFACAKSRCALLPELSEWNAPGAHRCNHTRRPTTIGNGARRPWT